MKVRKVLLRIIASVLALFFTANVLICSLSYAYLGDPLGLFKIIRVAQIVNNHYVSGVDGKSLLSGALEGSSMAFNRYRIVLLRVRSL